MSNRRMRLMFGVLSVMLIAIFVFTACAGGGAPAPAAEEKPAAEKPAEEKPAEKREIVWMVRTRTVENPWELEVVKPA